MYPPEIICQPCFWFDRTQQCPFVSCKYLHIRRSKRIMPAQTAAVEYVNSMEKQMAIEKSAITKKIKRLGCTLKKQHEEFVLKSIKCQLLELGYSEYLGKYFVVLFFFLYLYFDCYCF